MSGDAVLLDSDFGSCLRYRVAGPSPYPEVQNRGELGVGVLMLPVLGFLSYELMESVGIEKLLPWTIPPGAFVFVSALVPLIRKKWRNPAGTNKYLKRI